ncbi:uncharacterized protein LOC112556368 [Pomacea canaliculata]|uniref:uncharacterized protein LOC112556368 n=1 Tax=Pomacea canaliculata TaxID=400727 RepID=UPI000D73483D|nr:uncharacterized protein LOC112556368 [Pomacea canaliculata]
MEMELCWMLVLVAHLLPHVFCLSVDSSRDQRLELMATSIKELRELAEKLDKRLDEHDKIIQQMKLFLDREEGRMQMPALTHANIRKSAESLFLDKRSDDIASWEPVVAQVTQRLNLAEADIQALKNADIAEQQARGTTYVRWGNNACPSSSEIVYSGYVGGSWYAHAGAATNYLCLPPDPTFTNHTLPRYAHAFVYGAEYETCDEPECNLSPTCAVCHTPRESSVMLPARNTCHPGWTLEYSGYLMTNAPSYAGSMEYICVDSGMGYIPSNKADDNGAMLHYTIYQCGSLPCPPYIGDRIVVCAVCSK